MSAASFKLTPLGFDLDPISRRSHEGDFHD